MKKVIGILFLIVILIATTVLAAYPEDLENAELEQTQEESITTLTKEQLENAESLIEEPATGDLDILEITEKNRMIDNNESVLNSDLYQFDEEVSLNSIVNGNVYVIAQSVKFDNAVIYGNAYVLAQNIELKNVDIQGSLYVCGQNIEISGKINDIYACGAEVNLSEGTYITRDVKLAGESLKIDGTIQRDAFIGAKNLTITGDTVINGTLNYASENEANIPDSAMISNVNFEKINTDVENQNDEDKNVVVDYIYKLLKIVATTAILSLIIISFVDKFSKMNRTEKIANDLLKDAGIGALILILTPILTIILAVSNIFTSIGISGLLIYIVGLILATSMTSIEIAKRIVDKMQNELGKWKKVGIASLVTLVYGIVGFIPVVGTICKFAFLLIGLGILFNLIFKNNKTVEN